MNATTKSGCGCGGSGQSLGTVAKRVSTGCGCSGGSTCTCGGGGALQASAFVRPKFFPGQLLTEEDLSSMMDYLVAKQKLQNKMLFGDGVVCGLEVSCHPCGGGHVVVNAGYALDCCGNDLVVPCPTEVDITAMIRDLQKELGRDCNEPCKEIKKAKCPPPINEAASAGSAADSTSAAEATQTGPAPNMPPMYCLYLRYGEQEIEPVAPYTTDDACASQECQFSRIQEGYRFELRCPMDRAQRPDFVRNLLACLNALVPDEGAIPLIRTIMIRAAVLSAAEPIANEEAGASEAAVPGSPPPGLEEKAEWLEAATGAFLRTGNGEKKALLEVIGQIEAASIERERLAPIAAQVVDGITAICKRWLSDQAPLQHYEGRLLAAGAALNASLYSVLAKAITALRQRLYDVSLGGTTCTLPKAIARLAVPPPAAGELTRADVANLRKSLVDTWRLLLQYLQDCVCRALLPKCPPCDDPAVLLACVTVEDCEVTDICNMGRTFVLSPVANRYWFGLALDTLGGLLQSACCEDLPFDFGSSKKVQVEKPQLRAAQAPIAINDRMLELFKLTTLGSQPELKAIRQQLDLPALGLRMARDVGARLGVPRTTMAEVLPPPEAPPVAQPQVPPTKPAPKVTPPKPERPLRKRPGGDSNG